MIQSEGIPSGQYQASTPFADTLDGHWQSYHLWRNLWHYACCTNLPWIKKTLSKAPIIRMQNEA
jgi:hypothetical protein